MHCKQLSSARMVLSALESCIGAVEPKFLVQNSTRLTRQQRGGLQPSSHQVLSISDVYGNTHDFNFDSFESVYIVGAGKASYAMAEGLVSVLRGLKIGSGAITVPKNKKVPANLENIKITKASHPIPDNAGVTGTRRIIRVLKKVRENDLVFILVSGGGSALLPLPANGISLEDKKVVTKLLLASGADIHEINTVRKHLSAVKGGQLLRNIAGGCTVISLVLSDVVGDDLEIIASGPTTPDPSTFKDAYRVLDRHGLAGNASLKPVVDLVRRGIAGKIPETPKKGDPVFRSVRNVLIGTNSLACKSLQEFFAHNNVSPFNLGSNFTGDAKDMGQFLAHSLVDYSAGNAKSFAVICGGETTVKLGGGKNKRVGKGGRNQEVALSCAIALAKRSGGYRDLGDFAVACIGTDGIDGNSAAAGAIITPYTLDMAAEKRVDFQKYLENHDSYNALEKVGSLVVTGLTGTNVNDVAVICRMMTKGEISS